MFEYYLDANVSLDGKIIFNYGDLDIHSNSIFSNTKYTDAEIKEIIRMCYLYLKYVKKESFDRVREAIAIRNIMCDGSGSDDWMDFTSNKRTDIIYLSGKK